MDNIQNCTNGYKGKLTPEQCAMLSNQGVTFTYKKGFFGDVKTAKKNGVNYDVIAWVQQQAQARAQAQAQAEAQAQARARAQAQAQAEAQGSFKHGTGGWVKCNKFSEPGCVPRSRLVIQDKNFDVHPCDDAYVVKQNDGRGRTITYDGTNGTTMTLSKQCYQTKNIGGRFHMGVTKRRKPKRKTRRQ